jgi:hypothetical protein
MMRTDARTMGAFAASIVNQIAVDTKAISITAAVKYGLMRSAIDIIEVAPVSGV